jgi:hypothetical protein
MATPTQAVRWKEIIRRLYGRATPYWRKRLEDEQEPSRVWAIGEQVIFQIIFAMFLGLLVLLPAAYIALLVFVQPGGLPQVIGSQLADVCRATGNCDIHYLLAAYAFAINFVIVASVFTVVTIGRASAYGQSPSDLEQDLAYIDERIVSLRNELVMAGIITLPAEERKDDG